MPASLSPTRSAASTHSPAALPRLYADMLRIRMVEEAVAAEYPKQEMRCPVHLSIGQEAAAVGVCSVLAKHDQVLSAHRAHAHYLAKGGDLNAMIAEFFGKSTGCCGGKGGSMHLTDLGAGFVAATPILGSTIPIAVGLAFGHVQRGNPDRRVVAVFLGDAATEEGVFHESLNFAKLKKLPVLFVCENNLYSVYSPLSVRQPAGAAIHKIAAAHGLSVSTGDGNDVQQVSTLAAAAADSARRGDGPAFLELATYRWREHCGPNDDDHLAYRPPGELAQWKNQCPIARLEQHLLKSGELTIASITALREKISREIAAAFAFARQSPWPPPEAAATDVYSSP